MAAKSTSRRKLAGASNLLVGWSKRWVTDIWHPLYSFILVSFYSLAKILEKRNLSPAKLDEIKIKSNILSAFSKQEEETKAGRDESEL
jgi:hypothetical protein